MQNRPTNVFKQLHRNHGNIDKRQSEGATFGLCARPQLDLRNDPWPRLISSPSKTKFSGRLISSVWFFFLRDSFKMIACSFRTASIPITDLRFRVLSRCTNKLLLAYLDFRAHVRVCLRTSSIVSSLLVGYLVQYLSRPLENLQESLGLFGSLRVSLGLLAHIC